jgi:putative radical SAM enzyme (TIGR03279 family)
VTPEKAHQVITQVEALQAEFRKQLGTTFAWLADEWFLIGRQPLPSEAHYETYPQIGNGVGSIQLFLKEFVAAAAHLPPQVNPARRFTWVVGNAVEQAFAPIVTRLNQVDGLSVAMAALSSDYWGQEITVTGLLTGQDIYEGLKGQDLGNGLLLPSLMLKRNHSHRLEDAYFLDDISVADLSRQLNCPIWILDDIQSLLRICTEPT